MVGWTVAVEVAWPSAWTALGQFDGLEGVWNSEFRTSGLRTPGW